MAIFRRLGLLILLILLVVGALAAYQFLPLVEGDAPQVKLGGELTHLGRRTPLNLVVTDQGRGLDYVRVVVEQNGRQHPVLDEKMPALAREAQFDLALEPLKMGLAQGKATVVIEARDRSYRQWLHGNRTQLVLPVEVDTTPPTVQVLTRRIYLNRGGTALVIYQVSPDVVRHGVQVDDHFYRGFAPWPDQPQARLCYFAYSQDAKQDAKINLVAQDQAGNQASGGLSIKLRWKEFRHDQVQLSTSFFEAIQQKFIGRLPADVTTPLAAFTYVNRDLRYGANQTLSQVGAQTMDRQLWRDTFQRSLGKTMAGFGDRRTYMFEGKPVGESVHLGVDLADTAQSPIPAAADGAVLFAGDLGIYGNTVILDHGLGLASLYGHMSSLEVKVGQRVSAGQRLGLSGATGMALGDHLHFSVLLDGVFVDPREWWDPHWLEDNILLRFSEAGLPAPLADAPGK